LKINSPDTNFLIDI